MLRITGGKFRSRKLVAPESNLTKPTMDRVREGVFNALGFDIKDKVVLDLFAGSGSYGFESISRGAKKAVFVDRSLQANQAIKDNIKTLELDNCDVVYADSIAFIYECNEKFDIIFIDPPYKDNIYVELLEIISKRALLNNKGIIVLESENELNLDSSSFSSIRYYKYGLAKICILRK